MSLGLAHVEHRAGSILEQVHSRPGRKVAGLFTQPLQDGLTIAHQVTHNIINGTDAFNLILFRPGEPFLGHAEKRRKKPFWRIGPRQIKPCCGQADYRSGPRSFNSDVCERRSRLAAFNSP